MSVPNPTPSSEVTTKVMKANKGKNTGPEIRLRSLLRTHGYPGYRIGWKGVPGHPDICYPGRKVAIFVNGCFWHRCPSCNLPLPKTNTEFWKEKFERNVERDRRKTCELESMGWTVITVWECELRKDPGAVVTRITRNLADRHRFRLVYLPSVR